MSPVPAPSKYLRRGAGTRIGRLPKEHREEVNRMIAEARPASEIALWLNDRALPGSGSFSESHVETWRQSGYLDHLARLERLDEIRLRSEASVEMVKAIARHGKVPIGEANDILLASLIAEALESFDPEILKEALAEDPKRFFSLASAVTGQAAERVRRERLELEFEKFRDAVSERRRKIEASLHEAARTGGIAPETLARIEEELKLL